MMVIVEIRAVTACEGEIAWCTEQEADMFGVYVGVPGDMLWVADFANYLDAKAFAEEQALSHDVQIKDYVKADRESLYR